MKDSKLIIENFAGIKSAEIEINDITLLIGPQASGKSVIAKLVYFFNDLLNVSTLLKTDVFSDLYDTSQLRDFIKRFKMIKINMFESFFPPESWTQNFCIEYRQLNKSFKISKSNQSSKLNLEINGCDEDLENLRNIIKFRDNYQEFRLKEVRIHQLIYELKEKKELLENLYEKMKKGTDEDAKLRKEIEQIQERLANLEYELHNRMDIDFGYFYKLLTRYKYNNIFIPANRSFFALLKESFFELLESNVTIDPFIINFGKYWENAKASYGGRKFANILKKFLNAKYIRERDSEFLLHDDLRKVPLFMSSSGQQELLPVLMVLIYLKMMGSTDSMSNFVFFEEPETHLFPETQKHLVEFLAEVFNSSEKLRFFITTHSPYILTSFNNLIYAAYVSEKFRKNKARLAELKKIVPQNRWISPDRISTYAVDPDKGVYKIQEEETGLISQTVLDEISDKISIEFEKLLNIEFGDAR